MLPLLAAALLVQDPPPDPPQAPDPPKGIRLVEPAAILKFRWDGDSLVPPEQLPEGLPAELADRLRTLRGDSRADLLKDLSTARESVSGGPRQIYVGAPDAPGELSSFTVLNFPFTESNPTRPAGPLTGTLKLTAADGTVTEYRAEFTPDPPAEAEPAPKYRLGIALDSMEPTGDPPGLPVREVLEDSPAAKAGVEDGDRVISVGDEPLASFPMLREKIAAAAEKGEPLRIKVVRGDAVKNGGGGEGAGRPHPAVRGDAGTDRIGGGRQDRAAGGCRRGADAPVAVRQGRPAAGVSILRPGDGAAADAARAPGTARDPPRKGRGEN